MNNTITISSGDMFQISALHSGLVNIMANVTGMPEVGCNWNGIWEKITDRYGTLTITNTGSYGQRFYNLFVDGSWRGWKLIWDSVNFPLYQAPMAFTSPSPIATSGGITVNKNRFNMVYLHFAINHNPIDAGAIFCTLPEGYRPLQLIELPATIFVGGTPYPALIDIYPDGNVVSSYGFARATATQFNQFFYV